MIKTKLPLIVIAGPTASGKSAAALELAQKINGEIICADSRTIYQYASIGTAKPAKKEQALIKHYGLDLVELSESFTAHDFKNYAKKTINEIKQKNKLPILVGGSGLYIDGLVYDFSFRSTPNLDVRSKLNNLNVSELQSLVNKQKLPMPTNSLNKRHLIRVIETNGQESQKKFLPTDVIYTGLWPGDEELKYRINERVENMYNRGFLDEVAKLKKRYSSEQISLAGTGYQSALSYIDVQISLEEAKEHFKMSDWQLARRQRTWFKRNPDIKWFSQKKALQTHILSLLNK
jgi:tRNA dimethylallyltransferase